MVYKNQFKKIIIIIFSLISLIILFLFQNKIRNFFYSIFQPIEKFFWQKSTNLHEFIYFDKSDLVKENQKLRAENKKLLSLIYNLEKEKRENKELRKILNLNLPKEFELVIADVIGKSISKNSIIINLGSSDDLSDNMVVINSDKVLVGRITKVYKNFSEVKLLFDKKMKIPAQILKKNIKFLAKGNNSQYLEGIFIPINSSVSVGDVVFTASTITQTNNFIPDGILIGRISEIEKKDVKSFQKVKIKPFLDISQLENVFVIKNY